MLTSIQHVYIYFKIYTNISWLITPPPLRYSHPKIRPYPVLRAYCPLVSLNKALLNPYFWGGFLWGRLVDLPYINISVFQRPCEICFFDSQTPKAFRGSKHILAIHHEVFGGFWHSNGKSPFSIGNTFFRLLFFPLSYWSFRIHDHDASSNWCFPSSGVYFFPQGHSSIEETRQSLPIFFP